MQQRKYISRLRSQRSSSSNSLFCLPFGSRSCHICSQPNRNWCVPYRNLREETPFDVHFSIDCVVCRHNRHLPMSLVPAVIQNACCLFYSPSAFMTITSKRRVLTRQNRCILRQRSDHIVWHIDVYLECQNVYFRESSFTRARRFYILIVICLQRMAWTC